MQKSWEVGTCGMVRAMLGEKSDSCHTFVVTIVSSKSQRTEREANLASLGATTDQMICSGSRIGHSIQIPILFSKTIFLACGFRSSCDGRCTESFEIWIYLPSLISWRVICGTHITIKWKIWDTINCWLKGSHSSTPPGRTCITMDNGEMMLVLFPKTLNWYVTTILITTSSC